ncbi:MAG: GGDEF domain-containing protein [Rhodobacteraceae bacterium]|nr:GGDEF domain-containing protein [Paracoccaceae bacterium]
MNWKIRTKKHVWLTTVCVTMMTEISISAMVMLFFDRSEWVGLVRFSSIVSVFVGIPLTYVMATSFCRNNLLTDELRRLLNRDRLTDVATREYFYNQMDDMPDAYGSSLMIDIDWFKNVNDTYGHLSGDKVIRSVADVLCRSTREKDIVCRFGGEEFLVFLHGLNPDQAHIVAERMRLTVAEQVVDCYGTPVSVTVSIGGSLKDSLKGIEMAIQEADEALYMAKAAGRNQTVFNPNIKSVEKMLNGVQA